MRHKFKMLSIVVGIIFLVLAAHSKTEAAVKDLQVFTQTWNTVDVMVGDTGYLRPQTENLKDPLGQPVQIASWVYSSHDPSVVAVDGDGCYQAIQMGSSEHPGIFFIGNVTVLRDVYHSGIGGHVRGDFGKKQPDWVSVR